MEIDAWVGGYKVRSFPWIDGEHIYFNVQYYRPGQSISQSPAWDKTVYITDDAAGRDMAENWTSSLTEYVAGLQIADGEKVVLTASSRNLKWRPQMSELKPCPFPAGEIANIIEKLIPEIEAYMELYSYQRSALHGAVSELRRAQPNHIGGANKSSENAPLTIDELRGMDGEPVWTEYTDDEGGKHAGWHVVDVVDDNITLETIAGEMTLLYVMVKGKDTMYRVSAYRRKPEGGDR